MAMPKRYRSIMAKLNFGHPLTADDKAYIRGHPELDFGPNSGGNRPNKRKISSTRAAINTPIRRRFDHRSDEQIAVQTGRSQDLDNIFSFGFNFLKLRTAK